MPSARARALTFTLARAHAREAAAPGPTCPRGWTRTLRRLLRGREPGEPPRPPAPGAAGPAPGSGARQPGGGAALTSAFVLPPTQPSSSATAAVGGPAQPPGRRPTHSSPALAGWGALGKARNGGARPAPGTRPLTPAAPPAIHFSGSSGRPRGRDARWAPPPPDPTGEGSQRGRRRATEGARRPERTPAPSRRGSRPGGTPAPSTPRSGVRVPAPRPGR